MTLVRDDGVESRKNGKMAQLLSSARATERTILPNLHFSIMHKKLALIATLICQPFESPSTHGD
jgi:hypothetical protein